jgi:metabolite-proton symporter
MTAGRGSHNATKFRQLLSSKRFVTARSRAGFHATIGSVTRLSPEPDDRKQLRRAVIASTVGTTIEWYDFFLYSTVTGLVFAQLYFPKSDPAVGTLQAFGIYAVGFAARPVGAAIFGHYGDRIGRKSTLIATLLLMGIATFLVAFVPSYDQIGIWGAVLLTILRFIQGVGVGGEWGGSVLMSMEWAKTNAHRGFIASWPQFGVPAGLFLANLAVLAFSQISGGHFLAWGWRIPFFLSILLVAIGLYIRLNVLETPVFSRLVAENKIERTPMLEVIKRQGKEVLLSAVARMGEQAPFYIFTAFVFTYGTRVLGVSRDLLLTAVLTASVLSFFMIPFSGYVSDRIGRKRMYMIGAATTGVFGFLYFALLNTMIPGWIFFAVMLSLIPHNMMYGPQAALIAESFSGRLRYSGASLGYQLASVIAGGPAPLIAAWLFATYGSGYAIAGYILFCAILSLISTAQLKDYTNRDISQEYDSTLNQPQPTRIAAYLAAVAIFSAAAIWPRDAMARIHNCEHASLLPDDVGRLYWVARRVLPAQHELMLAERCRWSDSAFAWVTTAKVIGEHDVAQWWMASCSRDARTWRCEPGVFHQEIETGVEVDGVSRRVRISFGGDTSLETAERLSSEALEIYAKQTATLPYCGGIQHQESKWRVLRESHPLPGATEEVHLTLYPDKDRVSVWFGDFVRPDDEQIGIDFPVPDAKQSGACWSARGS